MGSPLGPTLANIFMSYFEKKWLDECPNEYKPVYYRRYVDDIFALFSSKDQVEKFKNYFSSKHQNINFTHENENNDKLSFLDVNVFRENNMFVTNVYRKPTFSGIYTHFQSFIPKTYKFGLINSLLFRCFHLCSDLKKFHFEIEILKQILQKNKYPIEFIDETIKKFLDKIFTNRVKILTVPKKDIIIILPFLGKMSLEIRNKINHLIRSNTPYCRARVIFRSNCRLNMLFSFKDKISLFLRSNMVYKFKCGRCNTTYYGKTERHLKVRMGEHLGISALTGKKVKPDRESAIHEHLLFCNHLPDFEDFSILAQNYKHFKTTLMERLLISGMTLL